MCNREDCGEPKNSKPWCSACRCHTTEISLKVHFERNHPDPRIPGPVG
jgi:hypothetical protein